MRSICSLVFRYAIATGRAKRDTAADLKGALKTRSHTPRAALTDPKEIGGLLRAIDDFAGTFTVKAGLQLLALTFLSIPSFQDFMRPVLRFLSDNKEHTSREILEAVSSFKEFNFKEQDWAEKTPQGEYVIFNRIS